MVRCFARCNKMFNERDENLEDQIILHEHECYSCVSLKSLDDAKEAIDNVYTKARMQERVVHVKVVHECWKIVDAVEKGVWKNDPALFLDNVRILKKKLEGLYES